MQKPRILIFDDEPEFIRLLKFALEQTGRYQLEEEDDSANALGTAVTFRPDLVLLDTARPFADGAHIALQIRADPRFHDTPIVFLSAAVSNREGKRTQIAGFPAIPKPIGLADLVRTIDLCVAA